MKKLKTLFILISAALPVAALLSHLAAQRANRAAEPAKQLLHGEAPRGDSEGADALWLLAYDIPDAAERRRIMAGLGNRMPADNQLPESLLRRRLIPDNAESGRLNCTPKNDDGTASAGCLHNVRTHAEAYRAAVAQSAKILDNADRLTQYGDLDVRFGYPASDPLPRYQYLVYQTTPAAVDWLDGKPQAAFARICRNLHTGKTLQQSRNGLIPTMIGVAVIQRNTQLAAEMLAEQPQWAERLPEPCAAAFAPVPAERNAENYCRTVQAEYRFLSAAIADTPNQLRQEMPAWLVPAVFSVEHSQTLAAQRLSFACEPAARQAFAQDLPVSAPPDAEAAQIPWQHPACLRNLAGCALFNASLGQFDGYARRMQDMQMLQRAFQAALALYRLPEHQRAAALPNILAQHGSPARPLRYDAETQSIVFAPYVGHMQAESGIAVALPQQ